MRLHLEWSNEQEKIEITAELLGQLERLLRIAGELEGVTTGEVALTLVDDKAIHELNLHYRGIDRPTDVLSFAMHEAGEGEIEIVYELADGGETADYLPDPLGDIVISVERAIEQSKEYGHSIERELGFLFVHGFLHLLGYDHDDEESEHEMFAKQEEILQKAGLRR